MEASKEAKEKAVELVDKFKEYVHGYIGSSMLTNYEYPEQILSKAKECAIICVDEILNSGLLSPQLKRHYVMNIPPTNDELEYWQQVKHEIQQL